MARQKEVMVEIFHAEARRGKALRGQDTIYHVREKCMFLKVVKCCASYVYLNIFLQCKGKKWEPCYDVPAIF